jgi:hypothetical protein
MKEIEEVVPDNSTTLILGDAGSGKSATMASLMQYFHTKAWIGLVDKVGDWPKWVNDINSQTLKMPTNQDLHKVVCVDDAYQYYYAQEDEYEETTKAMDIISRARRHSNTSVIYTTQTSNVLTRRLIGMVNVLVFKESSLMQMRFERPEMRKVYEVADKELAKVNYEINKAYVEVKRFKGIVEVDMPGWYTNELSTYKAKPRDPKSEKHIGSTLIDLIKALGSMAE